MFVLLFLLFISIIIFFGVFFCPDFEISVSWISVNEDEQNCVVMFTVLKNDTEIK